MKSAYEREQDAIKKLKYEGTYRWRLPYTADRKLPYKVGDTIKIRRGDDEFSATIIVIDPTSPERGLSVMLRIEEDREVAIITMRVPGAHVAD